MRSSLRRLLLLATIGAVFALLLPMASASALDSASSIAASELHELDLMNAERSKAGLVPLRLDTRIASIARSRSVYMAKTGVFSHTEKDGSTAFSMIEDANITWYGAGEIIAWNSGTDLAGSATYAIDAWMDSSGHRAIILSKDYNYVGFGLAQASNGRRYWTGVFLKGPDRTGAYTNMGSASATGLTTMRSRVIVKWTGLDPRLQVLTAGLKDYTAQYRRDGEAWLNLGPKTGTSLTLDTWKGHTYTFRVRARDKSGNWGSWKTATVKL